MDTAYRVRPLRSTDPERLGDYLLVGRLGVGGMGVVYLAESDDGTPVAIKLIHTALASDAEFSGRFRSEVARARQVPPFCTAEFLAADLDHDPPYLVVEYIDGPSLDEVVTERGPLRSGALHSLAVGVATALTGIHGAGIIHRDLKPENVLLPPGSPKVIDFGIARPFDATSQHTRTDVMVGTVPYMAPERFSGEPGGTITAAADVFAWGCVIAYAGTGRTPFGGDSPSATAARILSQPPQLAGLPESLREPVSRALSKEPADRPTAPELLSMLLGEQLAPHRTATSDEPNQQQPRRPIRGRRALPIAVAAVLVLAGVIVFRPGGDHADTPRAASSPQVTANVEPSRSAVSSVGPPSPSPSPSPSTTPQATASSGPRRSVAPPTRTSPSPSAVPASANPSRQNLARGRFATASSSEGVAWEAARTVDGDPQSRWSSLFSDPQWLTVDLGTRWQISEIVLRWEAAHAVAYRLEISQDGERWKTVYATSAGRGGDVTVTTDKVPGRFVRIFGTRRSGQYGYSLYEIEVR